jgi:hypothetical protein
MNRAVFFNAVRESIFGGRLLPDQVSGCEAIMDAFQAAGLTDLRWLAYMLATAFHETAHTMQPIEEFGKGRGRKYGIPSGPFNKVYYGRGYVQLTWLHNYERAQRELGAPFVRFPEQVLEPSNAAKIMIRGMTEGWFTGKRLADFLGKKTDFTNARKIINGLDCAGKIAGYASHFNTALTGASA